jgi:hypothetical protein
LRLGNEVEHQGSQGNGGGEADPGVPVGVRLHARHRSKPWAATDRTDGYMRVRAYPARLGSHQLGQPPWQQSQPGIRRLLSQGVTGCGRPTITPVSARGAAGTKAGGPQF